MWGGKWGKCMPAQRMRFCFLIVRLCAGNQRRPVRIRKMQLSPVADLDDPIADLDEDSDDASQLVVDWRAGVCDLVDAKIVSANINVSEALLPLADGVDASAKSPQPASSTISPASSMPLTGFWEQLEVRAEGLPESSATSTIGAVAAAVAAAARAPLRQEQPHAGGGSLLLAAQANAAHAREAEMAATELVYRSALAEVEAEAEALAHRQRLTAAAATAEVAAATALARRDADAAQSAAVAARAEAAAARSAERAARSVGRVDTREASQQTEAVAAPSTYACASVPALPPATASPPHTPPASRHRPAIRATDSSRPPRPTPERPPSLTGGNHEGAPATARPRRLPMSSCDDVALEAARAELHLRRKQMQRLKRLEGKFTREQLVSAWDGRDSRERRVC